MIKCEGCPNEAKYIVYGQAHCRDCMLEAIDCEVYVEVRTIDEHASKNQRHS